MRGPLSLTLSTVLAAGILAVPVAVLPSLTQEVSPDQSTIAVSGIDASALAEPGALDPVSVVLDGTPGKGKLAAITGRLDTQSFMVTGVTWDLTEDADVTDVAARIRENGTWSAWTQLPVSDNPDVNLEGDVTPRGGTEPLTSVGADGIQVRISTADGTVPAGTEIELIDPHVTAMDAQLTSPGGSVAQAADNRDVLKPKVITRSQWGAKESLGGAWNETSNGIKSIYIHHTAGANSYTAAQAPALVRGIYSYHTTGMRWADIGYQFLVDKYGNIYQGRRNATVDTPIGAQTGGYNTNTIGVSALGNYQTVKPTEPLLEALESVVAWKAYEYGLDPLGRTKLTTGTSSKSTTRARAGTTVSVNVIQGHRDTNFTACPGQYLYAQLPAIRTSVSDRMNGASIAYGSLIDSIKHPTRIVPANTQAPVQWTAASTYQWKKVTGAVSYQVLTQSSSSWKSGSPSNRAWNLYKSTKSTKVSVKIPAGATRVIGVRAVDSAGRRGPIRILATASGPVPRTQWTFKKSAWKTKKSSGYWSGGALRTSKKGAKISLKSAKSVKYVVFRARTGPGAGAVKVKVGNVTKTVSFKSKKVNPSAVVKVTLPKVASGTVTVATRSGKAVFISGIGLGRAARKTVPARKAGPAAPPVTVSTDASDVLAATQTVTWTAPAGASSFYVLTRKALADDAGLGPWTKTATKKRSLTVPVAEGEYVEVAVLAKKGTTWSTAAAVPIFSRSIDFSAVTLNRGWSLLLGSQVSPPAIKALTAASNNAVITLPKVGSATSAQILAATGPDQGTLVIEDSGIAVATLNLSILPASQASLIRVPFTKTVSAKLKVRTVGTNPITIFGIGFTRA
ncbi:hypothetical protein GCM10010401_03330 [Rarobacter faecitabidus]|uniref:Uncharacterized protein with LGFP repeats n=1 Tax=Rarobacter faecitabidus TaxID=13243 RepID=A0A542ZU78_RARFA|nr:N-acetylmuramoyl-L-alanine amidase [Rarobacter faecitabidus]TQL63911.1 uncharacterized protein with LGFP repeats [Rarobacter faecitabidus]